MLGMKWFLDSELSAKLVRSASDEKCQKYSCVPSDNEETISLLYISKSWHQVFAIIREQFDAKTKAFRTW
jgi:hypothetical protein